jgi:hypothetical protein
MSQRRQRPLQALVLPGAGRQGLEEQLTCKDVQQWTTLILWIPLSLGVAARCVISLLTAVNVC